MPEPLTNPERVRRRIPAGGKTKRPSPDKGFSGNQFFGLEGEDIRGAFSAGLQFPLPLLPQTSPWCLIRTAWPPFPLRWCWTG